MRDAFAELATFSISLENARVQSDGHFDPILWKIPDY